MERRASVHEGGIGGIFRGRIVDDLKCTPEEFRAKINMKYFYDIEKSFSFPILRE